MPKWLSLFRAVVIKPLPDQVVEEIPEAEGSAVEEVEEEEVSVPKAPTFRYKKRMRILPVEPKVQQNVPWAAWGRCPPHMRYNCDQVPFNLDNSGRKTYIKAQSDVAVISGQPGSEKRFGTLQVCLHAGKSSQPPLTIIFRGGGPKRFEREFPRYHPGVRVLWQPKAWMDSQLAVTWASQVFVPFLEDKHPGDRQVLLLQDSLKAQRTGEYVRFLQSRGVESAYGPRNQTEYWQPIDAGHVGAVLKQLGRAELEKWMETPSNPDAPPESRQYHWQLWESNKMQASEKRILMTWVFGRAWEQLLTPRCVQPQKT